MYHCIQYSYYSNVFLWFYYRTLGSSLLRSTDSKQQLTLAYNTVQIIVLSVDSLINMVGGIKGLISESCNIGGGREKKKTKSIDQEKVRR